MEFSIIHKFIVEYGFYVMLSITFIFNFLIPTINKFVNWKELVKKIPDLVKEAEKIYSSIEKSGVQKLNWVLEQLNNNKIITEKQKKKLTKIIEKIVKMANILK